MILVPLPFFVSLLLVGLLLRTVRRETDGTPAHPLFAALIAAYAVQSVLVGLRWGYDMREVLRLMSPLAALIAPLAFLSFRSLTEEGSPRMIRNGWAHLLPAALVTVLGFLWPDPIGAVIIAVFLGYGTALLWQARLGPDGLVAARLDGVLRSYRALQITGLALVASAATDIFVSIDLVWSGGAYSAALIGAGNVLALLVLGKAASMASIDPAETGQAEPAPPADLAPPGDLPPPANLARPTDQHLAVTAAVEALMRDDRLYRDVDLNLGKIARKLRISPRDVSTAINRAHGMSVSQYVNTFRVEHACALLRETKEPITQIMFEAGFLTKSNFNREFLRVTGASPTAWRQARKNGI